MFHICKVLKRSKLAKTYNFIFGQIFVGQNFRHLYQDLVPKNVHLDDELRLPYHCPLEELFAKELSDSLVES